jgi:choline-sulfatase
VLVIITDEQHAGMLGCAGNPHVRTPNLDRLAAQGTRFERAYSANPICVPARLAMMTGRMPSSIGMEANQDIGKRVPPNILQHAMGRLFRDGGYRTVYGGKVHLPGGDGSANRIDEYGFEYLTKDERGKLAETCAAWLRENRRGDRPFLMVASFINPHDICYMAISAHAQATGAPAQVNLLADGPAEAIGYLHEALQLPGGLGEEKFFAEVCPPLPANHEVPREELSAFMDDKPASVHYARRSWTERDWRLHRWAYARLTERVDAEIEKLFWGLREAGLEDNTVVIMTSDHGDQDASHRLERKAVLYEESVHVPFIVSWKGVTRAGSVDRRHLVSSGLDLIPTICDFAGIALPGALKGMSVRPLAEGRMPRRWREHLVVENHLARLVHDGRWKYMVGREGRHAQGCRACTDNAGEWDGHVREMLVNLQTDSGEMNNLAGDPRSRERLEAGRAALRQWCRDNQVELDSAYVAG